MTVLNKYMYFILGCILFILVCFNVILYFLSFSLNISVLEFQDE